MLNTVALQGRLTKDPVLRHTQSNVTAASFSVAVERDIVDRNTGKRGVDFIDCVAWRGTADFIDKYFHQGDQIILTGRLQQREWTDKEGNKRKTTEVLVSNAYFTGSKPSSQQGGSMFTELEEEGDLPF